MTPSGPREGAFHVSASAGAGSHRIAYLEWGAPDAAATAVCVHGLTGRGLDFEQLAPALATAGYRVVCPDMVGRGESDWLSDPADYRLKQYASDMAGLLEHVGVAQVDWVGTSMGGLIGLATAAASPSSVRRLVLNDIGPFIPRSALQRLASYTGSDPVFESLAEAEAYVRDHYAPFGDLTDVQWRRMAEQRTRPRAGGGYVLHYDPAIALNLRESAERDSDLWRLWDAVTCPVLVLRGATSDLLLTETVVEMTGRGPSFELVEFPECGHNPPLIERDQIDPVIAWLGPAGAT